MRRLAEQKHSPGGLRWLAVLFAPLLVLALLACNGNGQVERGERQTPEEVLQGVLEANSTLQSYRAAFTLSLTGEGLTLEGKGSLEVASPDTFHGTISLLNFDIDVYRISDQLYFQDPITGEWQKSSIEGAKELSLEGFSPSAFLEAFEGLEELPREPVGGVQARHLRAQVSLAKLLGVLQSLLPQDSDREALELESDVTFPYELWVDPATFYLLKAQVAMDIGRLVSSIAEGEQEGLEVVEDFPFPLQGLTATVIITFSDFNDPGIQVELPEEAKGARETDV